MEKTRKGVVIKKEKIDEALGQTPAQGKHTLEPIKSLAKEVGLPFNILEDYKISNKAEIHVKKGDLWLCLEGEVTFIHGGELVDPWVKEKPDGTRDDMELRAKEIKNGEETVLHSGDWLWIPAGVPHTHRTDGVARLAIIKVPAMG